MGDIRYLMQPTGTIYIIILHYLRELMVPCGHIRWCSIERGCLSQDVLNTRTTCQQYFMY